MKDLLGRNELLAVINNVFTNGTLVTCELIV